MHNHMSDKISRTFATLSLLILIVLAVPAQEIVPYKQLDSSSLELEILRPPLASKKLSPAIIFFFGGGWKGGDRNHFRGQATHLAKRGLVCVLADYRTENSHGTSPFIALQDAKSAIRHLRKHAIALGIDPRKIVAAGGSAGGHLAAATAMCLGFDDPQDDLSTSCWPNALVLFNPVIDNGPAGYGFERIGEAYPSFSPLHNIRPGVPPTLILLGTADNLIPVETGQYFRKAMEQVGGSCQLVLYEGQPHGFFNPRFPENYRATLQAADDFLVSLGYLGQEPVVPIDP